MLVLVIIFTTIFCWLYSNADAIPSHDKESLGLALVASGIITLLSALPIAIISNFAGKEIVAEIPLCSFDYTSSSVEIDEDGTFYVVGKASSSDSSIDDYVFATDLGDGPSFYSVDAYWTTVTETEDTAALVVYQYKRNVIEDLILFPMPTTYEILIPNEPAGNANTLQSFFEEPIPSENIKTEVKPFDEIEEALYESNKH